MDNSKTIFRRHGKPAEVQPQSGYKPSPYPKGYIRKLNESDYDDDPFWAQPEDNEADQTRQGSPTRPTDVAATPASLESMASLQKSGSRSNPMPKKRAKGRQSNVKPREVHAEFARRLEAAAEKKRKRDESASNAQDESNAKPQRQTEDDVTAGIQDHAITEEVCKRPTEGGLKMRSAGKEEENSFPIKRPRLTDHRDIGLGPITAAPVMPDHGIKESSIMSLNTRRDEQAPRTFSYTLTEDEMAAVEEARTDTRLRLCTVTEYHHAVLQEVQDHAAPQRKHLYALTTSQQRFMEKSKKRESAQGMNLYHQLNEDEWAIVQQVRRSRAQIGADKRASMSGNATGSKAEKPKAESITVHHDQTGGVLTDILPTTREQSSDLQAAESGAELGADPEAEDELEWASGSEEGEIREYSHSTWGWTRWRD